ncbi:MAG: cupredoxin domain-containing protein [Candidatus Binataceae bacterium]
MHPQLKITVLGLVSVLALALAPAAYANSTAVQLTFDNNHFSPESVTVPARQPLVLKVMNQSSETIEFESFKLNRERSMQPGETIIVHLPALSPGTYDFYDDFHQSVPQGTIVAR